MEDRLAELETKISFQDQSIQELSDVVAQQDKLLIQIRAELNHIKNELKNQTPELLANQNEETPPPHY